MKLNQVKNIVIKNRGVFFSAVSKDIVFKQYFVDNFISYWV